MKAKYPSLSMLFVLPSTRGIRSTYIQPDILFFKSHLSGGTVFEMQRIPQDQASCTRMHSYFTTSGDVD